MQVSAWLSNIAFLFVLKTLVQSIQNHTREWQRLFPSFCAPPSKVVLLLDWMNNFFFSHFQKSFAHFSNVWPNRGPGLRAAQTVVHFAHFQVQAWKRGVLGWSGVCFCTSISQKGACDGGVKNKGWGWYSRQNETTTGQIETYLGKLHEKWVKVLWNWGGEIQSFRLESEQMPFSHAGRRFRSAALHKI